MDLEKLYNTIQKSQAVENFYTPGEVPNSQQPSLEKQIMENVANQSATEKIEIDPDDDTDEFEDDDLELEHIESVEESEQEEAFDQIEIPSNVIADNLKVIEENQVNLSPEKPKFQQQPEVQVPVEPQKKSRENLPDVIRCRSLKPIAKIQVYSISSDQMREYVIKKIRHFFPGVPANLIFMFTQPKKKERGPKGFASARLLVADSILDPEQRARTYYDRLGDPGKLHFLSNFQYNIIEKYKYNREQINGLLNNYKEMSKAEDMFGIDEKFLNDIRAYITPKKLEVNSNLNAIVLSVMPENIIQDMLTNIRSGKVNGKIEIKEIYMNKDVIHFIVYLHPEDMKSQQNPLVSLFIENSSGIKVY